MNGYGCDQCGVGPDDECTMDCPSRCQQFPPPITLNVTDAEKITQWLDARDLTPEARDAVLAVISELRGHIRPNIDFLTIWDWIDYGIDKGWATGACATHDGIPSTDEEDEAWDEGGDPCQPILRVWMP